MSEKFALTDEQRDAVTASLDQPWKIFAGAGTGKTTVLTHRYIYLVKKCGFPPEQVLALTFTRKAAAELRHRVREALDDPKAASRAEIWNFDAFWWNLLQENPHQSGIEDDWRIVDDIELELMRDEIIHNVYRYPEFQSLKLTCIEKIELSKILNEGYNQIPFLKCRLIDENNFEESLVDLWKNGNGHFSSEDNQRHREAISVLACLYQCYQDILYQKKLLHFGDVLIRTFQMFSNHPDLVEYYQNRYRYILVDETQDTNPAQFEILRLLSVPGQKNITVVGDDKQSIYGFRGTSPEKFRKFKAESKRLSENHRSPNEILNLATELICQDPYWKEQQAEIALKNPKRGEAEQPVIFLYGAENKEEEAKSVVARVRMLLSKGVSPDSIALLFRSRTHMGPFEKELTRWGIPHHSAGGTFYERPEIKDALALLKLLTDTEALGSLARLLERPPLSFGIQELQQVCCQVGTPDSTKRVGTPDSTKRVGTPDSTKRVGTPDSNETIGTPDGTESAGIINGTDSLQQVVEDLKSRLQEVGAMSQGISLPELIYQAMVHSGVLAAGCLDPISGDRIRRNCAKLLQLAMPWTPEVVENPLKYFTQMFEYQVMENIEEEEDPGEENCIQLLTIHRAKGLEFDHVFWCDVRSSKTGSAGILTLDLELDDISEGNLQISGKGLIMKPAPGQPQTETRFEVYKNEKTSKVRDDEEKRLHYVTVTRAKQTLTITCSLSKGKVPPLFETIREISKGNPAFQEKWDIPQESQAKSIADDLKLPDSEDYWIPRLQPLATSLQRRLEACFFPSDPLHISFADLEDYRKCPRLLMWSLMGRKEEELEAEYIQEPEDRRGESGMEFGRMAHRLLRDLPRFPDCVKHLGKYVSEEQLSDSSGAMARLKRIIQNYNDLGFSNTQDIQTEVPWTLSVKLDNDHRVIIRGVVDRIHHDSQGWVLLDYKTGKIDDELRDSYFRQLNLYRLAVEARLFPKVDSPRIIIVEIETGFIINVPRDMTIEPMISELGQSVFTQNFPAAESLEVCQSCQYRSINLLGIQPCNPLTYEGQYVR
jgi:DNA helicase-2/ATP-dependent DNA helicase PcrA